MEEVDRGLAFAGDHLCEVLAVLDDLNCGIARQPHTRLAHSVEVVRQ
jgi:hypothetical protein